MTTRRGLLAPTLTLYNGKIYTVDSAQPWAQAVALCGQHILAVGSNDLIRKLAGPETETIDLGGRLMLPGLCDAHVHFLGWSLGRQQVQLAGTRSKAEMLVRIAERAQSLPADAWIVGQGWNESFWGETAFPTRQDLDAVTGSDQPALFSRSDMHAAVANSAALHRAGITPATPDPPGGLIDRDADGQPTGVLRELAMGLVSRHIPDADAVQQEAALRDGMATMHRMGITAIHDQRMKEGTDGPKSLAAFQRLHHNGQLALRVSCNVAAKDLPHVQGLGLRTGLGNDSLRLGHVKVFTDGSLGSRTAWMLAPFEGQADNTGVNVTPVEQMAVEFRKATELGFPISVHAIGDRANQVCLEIFEELADGGLRPPVPHRIEHVQIVDPADLPRLAQLNVTASMQPIHATDDMDTADLLLGPRGAHMYNFRSLLDSGARLAFGSDAPVADANPFLGIHAALFRQRVTRMDRPAWYPDECISLPEAIHAYTLGAAQASGWENVIGSITPGKRADLIVLDRDLFALVAEGAQGSEVAETQVLMTIFDGEIVQQA